MRDAADIATLHEVFVDKEYDNVSIIPKSIADIGGHIGSAALFFATKYPAARIRVYEPEPSNFAVLVLNMKSLPQVSCVNIAVSDCNGTLDFYSSTSSIASSLHERSGTTKIQVNSTTLDSILAIPTDLIKFDIEGAEYRMFSASEHRGEVSAFVGELHYDLIGVSRESFLQLFTDYLCALKPIGTNRAVVAMQKVK